MTPSQPSPQAHAVASGVVSRTRVRLPRVLATIAKALFACGSLGAIGMMTEVPWLFFVPAILGVAAWPLFLASVILSLSESSAPGAVEVAPGEIAVTTGTKRVVIPASEVVGAAIIERPSFHTMLPSAEIELRNGDRLTVRVPDARYLQDAAVVDALGFASRTRAGRRVRMTLAQPSRRLLHVGIAFAIYFVGTIASMAAVIAGLGVRAPVQSFLPVFVLALYELAKRFFAAPVITVGDDGIVLARGFRRRFIARREIARIETYPGRDVVVVTHGGERIGLGGVGTDAARAASLAHLVEPRPTATTPETLVRYGRGDRSVAAWRAELAASMSQSHYRATAATADEAMAVLQSAEATRDQRVGAALALRVAGEPPARIRIAAEAAADDALRRALEAVAEGEDDARLERAVRVLR